MNDFLNKAREFYLHQFLTIKFAWQKPRSIAGILLIIEQLQLVALIVQDQPCLQNRVNAYLQYFKMYSIIDESIETKITFLFCIAIVYLAIIILVFYLVIRTKFNSAPKQLKIKQIYISETESHPRFSNQVLIQISLISIAVQTFQEISRFPITFCQLSILYEYYTLRPNSGYKEFGNIFALATFLPFQIVSAFIEVHNIEYRLKNSDHLAKYNSAHKSAIYFIQLRQAMSIVSITILRATQINSSALLFFGLLYQIYYFLLNFHQKLYQEFFISQMATIIAGGSSILVLLNLLFFHVFSANLMLTYYLFLFLFPLLLRIIFGVQQSKFLFCDLHNSDNLESNIRLLYQLLKRQIKCKKSNKLLNPNEALCIYTFITNHLRNCQKTAQRLPLKSQKEVCFCQEFFGKNQLVTFETIEQMKQFTKEFIAQTLEDEIYATEKLPTQLIYIYFLIQIKKVPTQAIYEVIKLSFTQKSVNLRTQAVINKVKKDALGEFQVIVYRNDLKNQKQNFQQIYQFEQSLKIIKGNLHIILKMYKDWLQKLMDRYLDIKKILKSGTEIFVTLKELELQIQECFRINPLSNELDTIYNIFSNYINFNHSRTKLYKLEGMIATAFMQSSKKVIFEPASCVIQITLLQPRGNVIHYTRSFQRAIGYRDVEIQNQNINKFMPQIISNDHDIYLNNFVEKGRINVVRSEYRVILCKNKDQFIVPINTRLRIETSPTEFGATAHITPVNLNFAYIMLNQNGKIEEITQNIFEKVFHKYLGCTLNQIKGVDALLFIPDLSDKWAEIMASDLEHLDRKFESSKIVIPKFAFSQSIRKGHTRGGFQKQLLEAYDQFQHSNILFYANIRVFALLTINLKLIILEIPEFRVLGAAQQLSSYQLIQIRKRSTIIQGERQAQMMIPAPSSSSSSGSGHLSKCDLEQEYLDEEDLMVSNFKNQIAIINSPHQIQVSSPIANSIPALLTNRVKELLNHTEQIQQDEFSSNESKFARRISRAIKPQINIPLNESSIGSKEGSSPYNLLKKQIKEALTSSSHQFRRFAIIFLIFGSILLATYLFNFLLIEQQSNNLETYFHYSQMPFYLPYLYYEFMILSNYVLREQEFNISILQHHCINEMNAELQYLSQLASIIPNLDSSENTLQDKYIAALQQILMLEVGSFNMNSFLQSNEFFDQQTLIIIQTDPILLYEVNFRVHLVWQLCIVIFFMTWLSTVYWEMRKRKKRLMNLFGLLSKNDIASLFIQFQNLYIYFGKIVRKEQVDPNEDFCEQLCANAVQMSQTTPDQPKELKKTKSPANYIQRIQNRSKYAILKRIIYVVLFSIVCCINFILTFAINEVNQSSLRQLYSEKIMLQKALYSLTQSYSYANIAINFTQNSIIHELFKASVAELQSQSNQLITKQFSSIPAVQQIFAESVCFSTQNLENSQYDNLFSYEDCQSIDLLTKNGLAILYQYLQTEQLELLYILEGSPEATKISGFPLQKIRLYVSLAIFQMVKIFDHQFESIIASIVIINGVILVTTILFTLGYMYNIVLNIRKSKQRYWKSKQLLLLIPLDKLATNAYIISFIQHEIGKAA